MYDVEYRTTWDVYAEKFRVIGKNAKGLKILYKETRFPLFLSNRDYVYSLKVDKLADKVTTGIATHSDEIYIREKPGKIRARTTQIFGLRETEAGTEVILHRHRLFRRL